LDIENKTYTKVYLDLAEYPDRDYIECVIIYNVSTFNPSTFC